jgi:hypothetical protein
MKNPSVKTRFSILIFLIFSIITLLCVHPVYNRITTKISAQAEKMRQKLEQTTGLSVSYGSISPSILTGLQVKGIVLLNVQGNRPLVTVRKVVLRYNLGKLLRHDYQNVCKSLVIDGVDINVNSGTDMVIVNKLLKYMQKQSDTSFNPDDFSARIPVAVTVRNVVFHYTDQAFSASVSIKKASLDYIEVTKSLHITAAGVFGITSVSNGISFSSNIDADGFLTDRLKNSSLLLHLSGLTGDKFKTGSINVLLSYKEHIVFLRSVQSIVPLALNCSYNIDTGIFSSDISSDHFVPLSFISLKKDTIPLLKKLRNVNLSVKAAINYNFKTKKFAYDSGGIIRLPSQLISGGADISYRLSGNRESVSVSSFRLSGRNDDVSFSGTYHFGSMQLSGMADIRRIIIPNGGVISAEIYFDPLEKGFMCFAPQLFLGGKSFTALQFSLIPHHDSFDFSFDASDYAHPEAEKSGSIRIDGSYLTATKYIQAGITASSLYLDSVAQTVAFFMNNHTGKTTATSLIGTLSPYMFSGEMYVSSDFKTISYNVLYALVANTKKDNEFLFLSLDGNNTSIQITQLDLLYGGKTLHVSAQVDVDPDVSGAFFTIDMSAGAIPYHFTGNLINDWFSVTGDYDFNFQIHHPAGNSYSGSLAAENFPVSIADSILTFSIDSNFSYNNQDGIIASVSRLETEDTGGKFHFHPKLTMSGSITKYGAFFDSVSYTDIYSVLNGNTRVMLNNNEGIFSSAHIDANFKNPLSDESVSLTADITNPENVILTKETIKNSIYLNAQLSLNDFGLNRFSPEQSDNNSLTAAAVVTGTFEKPYVSVNLDSLNLMISGMAVSAQGSASLEDRTLSIPSLNVRYGNFHINNLTADISLDSLTGKAAGELDFETMKKTIKAPLSLTVSDIRHKAGSFIPEAYTLTLASEAVTGSLVTRPFSFFVSLLYADNEAVIRTSDNIGLSGWINRSGALSFSIPDSYPFHLNASGTINREKIAIAVTDIHADLQYIFSLFNLDQFKIYGGILYGSMKINGIKTDPEFNGAFSVSDPDFCIPGLVPDHITTKKVMMTIDHNEMMVPDITMKIKDKPINMNAKIVFDRWKLDRIESSVTTPQGVCDPADLDVNFAVFSGETNVDLNLLYQDNILDVTGKVYVQNVNAQIRASEVTSALMTTKEGGPNNIRADLDIVLGPHVSVVFDPLLRCVFVPDTPFNFKIDQPANTFSIKGDINIRSGDIAYLNRSFYLKSGSIKFNDTDERFNPRITVRAETRGRDEDGNDIRIILSADNQYLSDFKPQFSSVPAKSEVEIRTLLGQIAVGDSNTMSNFLFAASDYAVQSTIGRIFENRLRQLLNFDIFSIRTMVLQNVLEQSLKGFNSHSTITVGNFFDDSTVYMGKYFGSALYADALLHWSYDETRIYDTSTAGGLLFQPEIGLELESPLVTIRWSTAPNVDAMINNRIVPSTSVTLSWKISF